MTHVTIQRSSDGRSRLWTGTFCILILVNICSSMALQMTVPIVAKYAISLGASLKFASAIASVMSFAGLLMCPFAGAIADRVNRKWLYVIASAAYGLCIISHFAVRDPVQLLLLRLLTGFAFSFTNLTIIAYSATYVPQDRYGEGVGYITLSTFAAQALGPGMGAYLLEHFGYSAAFASAGCFSLLSALTVVFISYEDVRRSVGKYKFSLRSLIEPRLLVFSLLAALYSMANGLVSTFMVLIGDERNIANVALFFTVYSLLMVLGRPVYGKLLDKKGVYFILFPSYLLSGLGLAAVGLSATLAAVLAAAVLMALGQGSGVPSVQAHCVRYMGKERAGVATSTCQIGQHVGNTIAPWLGGQMVSSFGYTATFCGFGAAMLTIGWAAMALQYRVIDRLPGAPSIPE